VVFAPDRSVAAYLALWCVHDSRYRLDLVVDDRWRSRGLGRRLLDFTIREGRAVDAASLQARPYATDTPALDLLASRDFRETMRMTGLVLDDVRAAALPPLSDLDRGLTSRGIRFTTLADELTVDARAWEKLRDAHHASQPGWADPDPLPGGETEAPETVDQFRARALQFGTIAEACFIAAEGERYLGYSALTATDEARTQAGSGGTAVRPAYRGLGIATALKGRCVVWARDHGFRRLATSSGNPAMVRVNEKFGFRRTYVEVRLVRRPV